MNKREAAHANSKRFAEDRNLKARQLEEEIARSGATTVQKANMMHTLSKLLMFGADERDQLTRLATGQTYYKDFLRDG